MYEKLEGNELLSEEMLLHVLGRHVETSIEAIERAISITNQLSVEEGSVYIVESYTLAPQLELLSILLERRADLIEMGDTLAFISTQEATGRWGAALVCTVDDENKTIDQNNKNGINFLPPINDEDKLSQVNEKCATDEHSQQLPTLEEREDDVYVDQVQLQGSKEDMKDSHNNGATNTDLVSNKLRRATDPLYWQYQDIREGRTDYKFAHYLSIDQIIGSLRAMQHASVVSERVNGPSEEITVQYMLEVLRLLIRASTWSPVSMLEASIRDNALPNGPGVMEIHEFSTFISTRLDDMGKTNPTALENLTRRYADLMSISRIFQETGGSVLPPVSTVPERYDVKKGASISSAVK